MGIRKHLLMMPYHGGSVNGGGGLRSGAKTQYRLTQELHYGTTTLLTDTAAFVDLFQSEYSAPNRAEGLREINIKNIGKVSIELDFTITAWTAAAPDEDGSAVYLRYILTAGESM